MYWSCHFVFLSWIIISFCPLVFLSPHYSSSRLGSFLSHLILSHLIFQTFYCFISFSHRYLSSLITYYLLFCLVSLPRLFFSSLLIIHLDLFNLIRSQLFPHFVFSSFHHSCLVSSFVLPWLNSFHAISHHFLISSLILSSNLFFFLLISLHLSCWLKYSHFSSCLFYLLGVFSLSHHFPCLIFVGSPFLISFVIIPLDLFNFLPHLFSDFGMSSLHLSCLVSSFVLPWLNSFHVISHQFLILSHLLSNHVFKLLFFSLSHLSSSLMLSPHLFTSFFFYLLCSCVFLHDSLFSFSSLIPSYFCLWCLLFLSVLLINSLISTLKLILLCHLFTSCLVSFVLSWLS